jgi:cell wall assembly regulator SMI1
VQKFTRPLTREIELANERLALTLSNEGITVRLVGSRKEPYQLSWAEVLCAISRQAEAAGAPSAEQVNAAVALVKKGAAKAAPKAAPAPTTAAPTHAAPAAQAPPTAGSAEGVSGVLERLERWLSQHHPRLLETLNPGARPADLDALQAHLGAPVPEPLQDLLRWHNGQANTSAGHLDSNWNLLGTDRLAAVKRELDESAAQTGWQTAWLPFANDAEGNCLCLDTTQAQAPVRVFRRGSPEHPIIAASLGEWLQGRVR